MKNPKQRLGALSRQSFIDIGFPALSEESGKNAEERRLSEDPPNPVLSHFPKNSAVAMKFV